MRELLDAEEILQQVIDLVVGLLLVMAVNVMMMVV